VSPAEIAKTLRRLADELDSNSGRVRFVCAFYSVEYGTPGLEPGPPRVVRLARNDIDGEEVADAATQLAHSVGRRIVPVS